MNTYRVLLSVPGRLGTPLIGDTIFGHVVWGIARHEGSAKAESFLEAFEKEPHFIVSSAFPHGFIPMPQLAPVSATPTSFDEYQEIKKCKKLRYVPKHVLGAGAPVNLKQLQEAAQQVHREEAVRQTIHNTVDRFGTGTLEEAGLFEQTELWIDYRDERDKSIVPNQLDLYVISTYDQGRVETLMRWAFESGFGAKISSGAGKVDVEKIEPCTLPLKGNRAMALAPFIPAPGEAADLRADIFLRRGKLGWEFGSTTNPFKKPIIFYAEGATFNAPAGQQWAGILVKNIHSDPRIRQQGMTPLYWFNDGGSQ